jgi:ubiquinone/menaquinone biosynthesis C-methylase UbiE
MEQAGQKPEQPAPQAIHHELRTAENSAGYVLAKLQSMKYANPNLKLLDVGSGSGTISVTFAKFIPDGHVTGVDLNPEILPRARAVAEQAGVKNVEFQQGDVFKLPFPDAHFDVTHCHQVLTHLKAPWDALREMLRVTKPGGIVAAREGDLETECVWPELPGLLSFHKFISNMMKLAGGSPIGGRQLLSWALKAGASRDHVKLSYGTWWYDTADDKKTWCESQISPSPPIQTLGKPV